jgi:hypothetical protein
MTSTTAMIDALETALAEAPADRAALSAVLTEVPRDHAKCKVMIAAEKAKCAAMSTTLRMVRSGLR